MIFEKKRVPTVTFERELLHYLVASKIILLGNVNSVSEQWFTNEPRYLIYDIIRRHFEESHACLSESQFQFALDAMIAEDTPRKQDIAAEYAIIARLKPQNEIGVVMASLRKATLLSDVEHLTVKVFESVENGNVDEALQQLKMGSLVLQKEEGEEDMVELWEDADDFVEEIVNRRDYPEKYAGIKTGFEKFDAETGGLFPQELTVVFGLAGKGKSTLLKQIGVNIRRGGYNVLHCANEENKFQIRAKYTAVETGIKYRNLKLGKFTDAELEQYKAYRQAVLEDKSAGKLYIHVFKQQTDATSIERKLTELKTRGVKIDLVIVDYLDLMSSIKRAFNENDEGGRATGDLKQLAIDFNVPVLVCTQANTTAEKQELRERPFLTAADVFGTKRKVHNANTLVGIVNQTATVGASERDENEVVKRHRLVICVPKNRDGSVFKFKLIMELETGRIFEDDGTLPVTEADVAIEQHTDNMLTEVKKMEDAEADAKANAAILNEMDKVQLKSRELNAKVTEMVEERLSAIANAGNAPVEASPGEEDAPVEEEEDNAFFNAPAVERYDNHDMEAELPKAAENPPVENPPLDEPKEEPKEEIKDSSETGGSEPAVSDVQIKEENPLGGNDGDAMDEDLEAMFAAVNNAESAEEDDAEVEGGMPCDLDDEEVFIRPGEGVLSTTPPSDEPPLQEDNTGGDDAPSGILARLRRRNG